MQQATEQRETSAQLVDDENVYGWISILLHWVVAIIVIALWLIGNSIYDGPADDADSRRQLHVSIAALAWLVILLRIVWRLRAGHPYIRGQSLLIHRTAKLAHYTMLTVLLAMLGSGPFLVWADGYAINIFDLLAISSPTGESESLRATAWFVHANAAKILLALVLLHIGGALKHLMFNSDDTVVRMLWPGKHRGSVTGP